MEKENRRSSLIRAKCRRKGDVRKCLCLVLFTCYLGFICFSLLIKSDYLNGVREKYNNQPESDADLLNTPGSGIHHRLRRDVSRPPDSLANTGECN